MLFPTFLENKFFPGGGGRGVGVKINKILNCVMYKYKYNTNNFIQFLQQAYHRIITKEEII